MPKKSHGNKHKKNKYYVSHEDSPTRSIMSGESPNALTNDNVFDFNPSPTTSKEQQPHNLISASALVEPTKDTNNDKEIINKDNNKDEDEHQSDLNSPILNNSKNDDDHRQTDAEKSIEKDNDHGIDNKRDKNDEGRLLNGSPDNVDSKIPNKNFEEEPAVDACIVNCLYYTIECCQCTIM